ncbi:MAG: HNH endonuclease [Thermomicrobia bacterium]|nr:HNH endonuclease [Thermomicrobia bacterium]MCA1722647.1 HNH endonuclease [Thermomicrobia bacterium]
MIWDAQAQHHRSAHRVSYELAHGSIPITLHVLHSCDNPPCVNPRHLHTGTHQENMDEAKARVRNGRYTTPEHTPRGEGHGNAKLTEAIVQECRMLHARGISCRQLALRYGVNSSTMTKVVQRKAWKHVA